MIEGILGKKLGMTSIFDELGRMIPVTVIEAGPVTVMQVKTPEKDGYAALQIGFDEKKLQRAKKPEVGHARKAQASPKRILKEVRISPEDVANYSAGQTLGVADMPFGKGDQVDIIGKSIGKGFAGVMKRHNFSGARATHGTHEYKRHAGSIGQSAAPSRVFKGKKMAGQLGNQRVTVQNLEIVEVRPEENLILIKGAVPGHNNGILNIRSAKKKKAGQAA